MRLGDAYRSRVIMPYAEDIEWVGGYGRFFPPEHKNLLVDRTVAAGELGVEGKSLFNLSGPRHRGGPGGLPANLA